MTFSKLFGYVRNGWPSDKRKVELDVVPYFKIRYEITVLNDVLLRNNQIIIPRSMRRLVLDKVHEGHMGVSRCQSLARQSVYWPNINSDIENIVSNCEICSKYQISNSRPELMPHDIGDVPWYKVGCDFFEFGKSVYILVVDYYSKYVEIDLLTNGHNSSNTIIKLKSIFARHGIPSILMSDNGPPFNSSEFRAFCRDWGIEHKTSSPFLPRSNGLAERSVQTVKKLLQKAFDSKSDPYIALLHYRTTELLMSRSLRTRVPSMPSNFEPRIIDRNEYKRNVEVCLEKTAKYYNRKSKILKPMNKGDNVMFKKTPSSCWIPGRIADVCKEPRSFVVLGDDGSMYRRSQEHIRDRRMNDGNERDNRNDECITRTDDDNIVEDHTLMNDTSKADDVVVHRADNTDRNAPGDM